MTWFITFFIAGFWAGTFVVWWSFEKSYGLSGRMGVWHSLTWFPYWLLNIIAALVDRVSQVIASLRSGNCK